MVDQETIDAVETPDVEESGAAAGAAKNAGPAGADNLEETATPSVGAEEIEEAGAAEGVERCADGDKAEEIKYDFTRPWTISSKFHDNLTSIAESFATQLSFSMSSYLRTTVDVTFQSVKQGLFQDHVDQLPESKCIGVFGFSPLRGQSVITVDGRLMFAFMDKLIGGVGTLHEVDRDFTEIETRIFMLVTGKMLGDLRDAAKKFFDASVNLTRIENNPAFIAVVTSGEQVIVISLEMAIGKIKGNVLVAIPMTSFNPVMSALEPTDEALLGGAEIPAEDRARINSALIDASVEVTAELGSTKITLEKLLALDVGDTVVLSRRMNEPVAVRVGETTVCYGEPGRSQNRKAIKVVT